MHGRDQVGALLSVYGSRTNALYFNANTGKVDELTLMMEGDNQKWIPTAKDIQIRESGRYFSPGNTKSIAYNKGYKQCIEYWATSNYQIRYSGGMAPDCYHIFAKREGIFSSISAPPKIGSKLRFLYECAPIAFLVEKAGGKSSDGF
jgi:sedoheptulose-bisphosphatase